MARDLAILSGGQTGVDRGALAAALELGAPCCRTAPLDSLHDRRIVGVTKAEDVGRLGSVRGRQGQIRVDR